MEQVRQAQEQGINLDLIISDWEMLRMDGLDFLKTLWDNPKTEKVPFIILTAQNDKTRVKGAMKSGATDCVVRPALEVLGEKVDKIFDVKV